MFERKLTEKDRKILEVISANVGAISPTEIGIKLGQSYSNASSYCFASLKKLTKMEKIIRIETNRVKYKLNKNAPRT